MAQREGPEWRHPTAPCAEAQSTKMLRTAIAGRGGHSSQYLILNFGEFSHTMSSTSEKGCDVLKVLPSVAWLLVCISGIPAYAKIGWKMPIVCAVLSSFISILATYDIFHYHKHHQYLVFGPRENDPKKSNWAVSKLLLAAAFAVTAFGLTAAFLATGCKKKKKCSTCIYIFTCRDNPCANPPPPLNVSFRNAHLRWVLEHYTPFFNTRLLHPNHGRHPVQLRLRSCQ